MFNTSPSLASRGRSSLGRLKVKWPYSTTAQFSSKRLMIIIFYHPGYFNTISIISIPPGKDTVGKAPGACSFNQVVSDFKELI
jgi:hypothetical protein